MLNNYKFNIHDALKFAKLSGLAYNEFEKDQLVFEAKLRGLGFKKLATFNDTKTNTQGFLVTDSLSAVLCFRGTYDIPGDIMTDLRGKLVNDGHEGIFNSFDSIQIEVREALTQVTHLPLYCTGHSLGGALAKAALLQLPQYNWRACYTFGSPPICTKEKSKQNSVPTFLIVNAGDLVPRVMNLEILGEAALLVLEGLNSIMKKHGAKSNLGETQKYAEEMKDDMKRYAHFGEARYFNTDGLCLSEGDSMAIFKAAVSSDLKYAIEHHKMDLYIANLEKYLSLQLVLTSEPNP